jgi:hypothetical protein
LLANPAVKETVEMTLKNVLTVSLLLFVAASIVVLTVKSLRRDASSGAASQAADGGAATSDEPRPQDGLVAYFFHGKKRCPACRKIETYAREAIETGFARQVSEGTVQWRVLDYEEPANEPFVDRYGVLTSTIVLVKMKDGEEAAPVNLEQQVWDLTDDKEAFITCVQQEAATLLE